MSTDCFGFVSEGDYCGDLILCDGCLAMGCSSLEECLDDTEKFDDGAFDDPPDDTMTVDKYDLSYDWTTDGRELIIWRPKRIWRKRLQRLRDAEDFPDAEDC